MLPAPTVHQNDVWLAKELEDECGLSDRDIRRLLKGHLIRRIRYGAYVDASLWDPADELTRHQLACRAVLKRAHPSSCLSHHSALAELRVPLWGVDLGEVHVTRTDGVSRRREAGVCHHTGRLSSDDLLWVGDVPIVPPVRAAVEVMCTESPEAALVLVDGLLHAGLTSVEEIATYAERTDRWPHSLGCRVVLALSDGRHQSVAERRFSFLCWTQRLPRPEPQVEVKNGSGDLVGIVDFVWPEYGVFLEFDGRIKYERFRREDESLERFLMREKKREERICQLTGWVCIRIGWADLQRPQPTAHRIRALLDSRRVSAS